MKATAPNAKIIKIAGLKKVLPLIVAPTAVARKIVTISIKLRQQFFLIFQLHHFL